MGTFPFPVREVSDFTYVDEGPPSDLPPILLLHGMLGHLSNWTHSVRGLPTHGYRVLVPMLPVYDMPLLRTSVPGLTEYTLEFLDALGVGQCIVVGNSLGGHIALLLALEAPGRTAGLVLAGSSGIYEVSMGTSMPRRYDPQFIREKAALTFYEPHHATDELVDELGTIIGDRARVLRLIKMARSAKEEILLDRLREIRMPTLLVWGEEDEITPPDVAEQFRVGIEGAELRWVPRCGHVPMIEHPDLFNGILVDFLNRHFGSPSGGGG